MNQQKQDKKFQKQISGIQDQYSKSEKTGVTTQTKQQISNQSLQSNHSSNFNFSVQQSKHILKNKQIQKIQAKNNQSSIQSHQISSQLHESTEVGYLQREKILKQIHEQPRQLQKEELDISNHQKNIKNQIPDPNQSDILSRTQNQNSTSYSVLFDFQIQTIPEKFRIIFQKIDKLNKKLRIRLDLLQNQEQSMEEFIQTFKRYEKFTYEIVIGKRTSLILIDRIFQMPLKELKYVELIHESLKQLRDDHGLYFLIKNLKEQPRQHNKKIQRITLNGDKISQKSLQSLMAIQFPKIKKVVFKFTDQMLIKRRNKIIIKVLKKFVNYSKFECLKYYLDYLQEQPDKEIQSLIDNKKLLFKQRKEKIKPNQRPQEGYWLQKNGIAKYVTFDQKDD